MQLRDIFDTPDLTVTDDEIANGEYEPLPGEPPALSRASGPLMVMPPGSSLMKLPPALRVRPWALL